MDDIVYCVITVKIDGEFSDVLFEGCYRDKDQACQRARLCFEENTEDILFNIKVDNPKGYMREYYEWIEKECKYRPGNYFYTYPDGTELSVQTFTAIVK